MVVRITPSSIYLRINMRKFNFVAKMIGITMFVKITRISFMIEGIFYL